MHPPVPPTDDSPRPIVLLAATTLLLLAVGVALPAIGFLLLAAVVYLGAALVAYVVFRMVVKFLVENMGENPGENLGESLANARAEEPAKGTADGSPEPHAAAPHRGGILTAWRPGVLGGLRVAMVVLALWAPFGLASVLLFGANGFVVHVLGDLVERTVDGMQAELGAPVHAIVTIREIAAYLAGRVIDAAQAAAIERYLAEHGATG